MKKLYTGVATAILLMASFGLATAADKRVNDPADDAEPDALDLVFAKAGGSKGKLVHTVKLDDPLDVVPEDAQILLQLNLDGDSDCEREFIWPPAGKVDVVRCGIGGGRKPGKIKEVGDDKLRFTFKKPVIDRAKSYRWRAITKICPGPCPVVDTLPDEKNGKPVYVKRKLR